jgi:hypothetical protein
MSFGTNIGTVKARMSGTACDNDLRADADVNVNLWFLAYKQ